MNALVLVAALLGQWDMTPKPSVKWKISPEAEEKLLQSVAPTPIPDLVPVPAKQPKPVPVKTGYPLRTGPQVWVKINGQHYSASVDHMMQGEHAGQFDRDWLMSLTQQDLDWLHSHHHYNTVDWSYAKKPKEYTKTTKPVVAEKKMKLVRQTICKNRRCYYQDVWVVDEGT